jgi:hypothetical protein
MNSSPPQWKDAYARNHFCGSESWFPNLNRCPRNAVGKLLRVFGSPSYLQELSAMKKLLVGGIVLVMVAVLSVNGVAQVKKGKTRLMQTRQLMGGLVRPSCAGIGEGLKAVPADDKAWVELATKAALLNEASYVLIDDGRCPDGEWANAAKALREGSAEVLAKLEAKDTAGAEQALKTMTQACAACHKAHKKST